MVPPTSSVLDRAGETPSVPQCRVSQDEGSNASGVQTPALPHGSRRPARTTSARTSEEQQPPSSISNACLQQALQRLDLYRQRQATGKEAEDGAEESCGPCGGVLLEDLDSSTDTATYALAWPTTCDGPSPPDGVTSAPTWLPGWQDLQRQAAQLARLPALTCLNISVCEDESVDVGRALLLLPLRCLTRLSKVSLIASSGSTRLCGMHIVDITEACPNLQQLTIVGPHVALEGCALCALEGRSSSVTELTLDVASLGLAAMHSLGSAEGLLSLEVTVAGTLSPEVEAFLRGLDLRSLTLHDDTRGTREFVTQGPRSMRHIKVCKRTDPQEDGFVLVMLKASSYDEVSLAIAQHLKADHRKVRLTRHCEFGKRPEPVPMKWCSVPTLNAMMLHKNQVNGVLYYEILDRTVLDVERILGIH